MSPFFSPKHNSNVPPNPLIDMTNMAIYVDTAKDRLVLSPRNAPE